MAFVPNSMLIAPLTQALIKGVVKVRGYLAVDVLDGQGCLHKLGHHLVLVQQLPRSPPQVAIQVPILQTSKRRWDRQCAFLPPGAGGQPI